MTAVLTYEMQSLLTKPLTALGISHTVTKLLRYSLEIATVQDLLCKDWGCVARLLSQAEQQQILDGLAASGFTQTEYVLEQDIEEVEK